VELAGRLPKLGADLEAEIGGRSKVSAVGTLDVSNGAVAELAVRARDVDLRSVSLDAPPSDIDADAALTVVAEGGSVHGQLDATTDPATLGGQPVPATEVSGTFNADGFRGSARLDEPGMPVTGDFDAHADGTVDFEARARRFTIQNAPRARSVVPATGSAELTVKGRVSGDELSAQVSGSVADFTGEGVHASSGRVNGRVSGKLSKPDQLSVDARIEGTDVSGDGFRFGKAKVSLNGPVSRPRVEAKLTDDYGPNVTASGSLSTRGGARIENLDLEVERRGAKVQGKIGRVDLAGGKIDVDHLKIRGASGELDADVHIRGDDVRLMAKGQNVDLDVLASILGLPRGTIGGRLQIDAALESDAQGQQGHVHLALGNAAFSVLEGIAIRLDATLDERHLDGKASVLVREMGSAGAQWQTTLAGRVTRVESWRDMLGKAKVALGNLDISKTLLAIPPSARIDRIAGKGYVQIDLERDDPAPLPNALIVAVTRGLEVVQSSAIPGGKPLEIQGIDVQVGGNFDGDHGEMTGMTQLVDSRGPLASTSGTLSVDVPRILANPKQLYAEIESAPLEALFVLDDRSIDALPEPIRPAGLAGHVGGRLAVGGSIATPTFSATAYCRGLVATSTRYALPVDIVANARYLKSTGELSVDADVEQAKRSVARLHVAGNAAWNDLIHGTPQDRPTWTGAGELVIDRMPLEVFAPFAQANTSGQLNGKVTLVHKTALPEIDAKLTLDHLFLDRIALGNGTFELESSNNLVNARLGFRDADGSLNATTTAGVRWAGLTPEIDPTRPVEIGLKARRFDSVFLLPVLEGVLSELNGDIDADLTAELTPEPDPDATQATRWSGRVRGSARMRDGELGLAHLGMKFNGVSFDAVAHGKGNETEIAIDRISARARSRVPNVEGSARLYLDRLSLSRATAHIQLTKPVPIQIEGVSQAQATGRAEIALERRTVSEDDDEPFLQGAKEYMDVKVDIPVLEARLPRSASRNVVDLQENPDIALSEPITEPIRKQSDAEIVPWRVSFHLGSRVKVTGDGLNLPVRGDPILTLAREAGLDGEIELVPGGRAEIAVQGLVSKGFVIENGVIRFDTDDPQNPHVDITASWRAPDGTVVFVDVRGTYREAKLSLRSDPPIGDQARIQALLLGGSASEGQTAGIGIGAGMLGTLLSDTPLGGVDFRTSSEQTGQRNYSTYSAAVRISDQVWFEGSYKRPEAASPKSEQGAAVSGSIDWRFRRNWSVRTEVGELGTKMDLLWRYRY
jgi:translocation and assembly module TamB